MGGMPPSPLWQRHCLYNITNILKEWTVVQIKGGRDECKIKQLETYIYFII